MEISWKHDISREGKRMKISVIMPINDNQKDTAVTIESILAQTYREIELIVIDTGVSSQKKKWINDLSCEDNRIKVYENKKEGDISESLNLGARAASGEYLMSISNGMALLPDAIEYIMHVFQRRKNEDFIYADASLGNCVGKGNADAQYLNKEIEKLYLYNPLRVCYVYKRKVQEILGGFKQEGIYDINNDFWIRANEAGFSMYHIKARLSCLMVQRSLLPENHREEVLKLRIKKCKESMAVCDNQVIKMKMLDAMIEECAHGGKRYECALFRVQRIILKNPINLNNIRKEKIMIDSQNTFSRLADCYEVAGGLQEPRKCYKPVMDMIRKNAAANVCLLDVGCGTGAMLKLVSEAFPNASKLLGIDISAAMVSEANKNLQNSNAHAVAGTIETAAVQKNYFDIELCMHSFHHYPEPLKSLRYMRRALRKNGMLIIVDNRYEGWKRIKINVDLFKNGCTTGDMWMYSFFELFILTQIAGFGEQKYQKIGDNSFAFTCRKR